MPFLSSLVSSLALLAALLPPAPAASVQRGPGIELFQNGGFEDGLTGWRVLNMSGSTTFELDARVRNSGQRGLKIERSGSPGRVDFLKQSADLGVRSGKVEVSLTYRLNDEGRVAADVYFFDAQGQTIGDGYVTLVEADKKRGNFKHARRAFTIPSGAHGVGLNVKVDRRGTVWIDDVSALLYSDDVPDAPPPALTLANPDFDKNLDGWAELEGGSKRFRATCDRKAPLRRYGALRLERRSPRLFPEDGVTTRVSSGSAKSVRLSLVALSEGDARGFVTLLALDAHDAPLASVRKAAAAAMSVDLELPSGTQAVEIRLTVGGQGTVWFDELALEEVGS